MPERRPGPLGRVGVFGVLARCLFPADHAPERAAANHDPNMGGSILDQPVSDRLRGETARDHQAEKHRKQQPVFSC